MSRANFGNLLKVLAGEVPDRATLFEFFLNRPLYEKLADSEAVKENPDWKWGSANPVVISAFKNAGYDYVTCYGSEMVFCPVQEDTGKASISLNAGDFITDRESFKRFDWPEPDAYDYSGLKDADKILPEGMKLIVWGPGGVLENVIGLVGFERLCMMLVDDANLAKDIFDAVGERLVRYYELCADYDTVGALISNDDWGFKTQTMLSPSDLRKYVFPWHKKIAEAIHSAGKPAILHSCGYAEDIMDDIIDDMKYDAKHSFEDAIEPVEEAYERWGGRIAILGGIDLDFVCRSSVDEIRARSKAMLDRSTSRGGYALGTGNSIPEYVPDENFLAMIGTVAEKR